MDMDHHQITVVGAGYVGLVTAACLADEDNQIICVDRDETKIEKLRSGQDTIYEPGLEEMLIRGLNSKRLAFTTDLKWAIHESTIILIAVGTPSEIDGEPDLENVFAVSRVIAQNMTRPKTIVMKSTVPPGTGKTICNLVSQIHPADIPPFSYVSNPEFLSQGRAVDNFL